MERSRSARTNIQGLRGRLLRGSCSVLERPLGAWLIFGLSLIITWFAWQFSNQNLRERSMERFSRSVVQLRQSISARLLEHEQVLRGGVGLFAASDFVSRDDWRRYVENYELEARFPSFQCMGVAVPVSPDSISQHQLAIQAEGFPDYQLYPAGVRDTHAAIVFIEPFDQRNKRAFGYDMYSEPNRRQAIDRAIDTGQPSISGKIVLVQETDAQPQYGFLYCLPVYRTGSHPTTVQERRDAFECLVYATVRVDDWMRRISKEQENRGIRLVVYDAPQCDPDARLFSSCPEPETRTTGQHSKLSVDLPLRLRGRDWTLHVEALDGFFRAGDHIQSHIVGIGGLVVDVLFFLVIASIGEQKQRAMKQARRMTEDLQDSEELTRSVLENVTEAIITVHVDGEIRMFNEAAESMLLCPVEQATGKNFDRYLFQLDWEQVLERIKDSPCGSVMVKCERSTGDVFPCRIALGRVATEKQFCYIITARDETARVESEKRMAEINQQLIDASHKSGMSEVVTGVLHNVGNILNSLQVSSNVMSDKLKRSHVSKLRKAADILQGHQSDLATFLTENPQGKQFIGYLDQLSNKLLFDHDQLQDELGAVSKNIEHIGQVIHSQQHNARVQLLNREEEPAALMEDAIQIVAGRNVSFNIQVVRGYQACPSIRSDRHKILQILVNLIKNAQEAVAEIEERPRVIRLAVSSPDPECVQLIVKDNGIGMTRDQVEKVLTFGFTTKPDGHGFGLHSCLNAARQLGGEISVESHGPGLGSRFTLTLPVTRDQPGPEDFAQSGTSETAEALSAV